MKFSETPLPGAFVVELDPRRDERGFFARAYSPRAFAEEGLETGLTEVSISRNALASTLRGMHFQKAPHGEVKLVRVVRGAAFDVVVDVREESPTYGQWFGCKLDAVSGQALYVPKGFAHGFLTLEDQTDVLYCISDTFHPQSATGFAWNDPDVRIQWPMEPCVMSAADRDLPPLRRIGGGR